MRFISTQKYDQITEWIISFLDEFPNKVQKLQTRITDNCQMLCYTNLES